MNSNKIVLSYVITTFNKLNYLKVILPSLISACAIDEEIVIVDGASTDGTKDYLKDLFEKGLIHQFVSEKDFGEAHGFNKALFLSRGEIIKVITDDDAFNYPAIKRCREYMLANPDIDIVGSDGYALDVSNGKEYFRKMENKHGYILWMNTKKPFIFCGLSIMLRKSSITLLGLFNPGVIIVDFEYTFRISSGKARIGWFDEPMFINIVNKSSNSYRNTAKMHLEYAKLYSYYEDYHKLLILLKIKSFFSPLYAFLRRFKNSKKDITELDYNYLFNQSTEFFDSKNIDA